LVIGLSQSDNSTEKRTRKSRVRKSSTAFRTISEVADDINVAQHVLRFWESKFKEIQPLKRGGGRRYYRPEDVELIKKIHNLLYNQGFTIRGVQKLLKTDKKLETLDVDTSVADLVIEERNSNNAAASLFDTAGKSGNDEMTRKALKILLEDLKSLRSLLNA